MTPRSPSQYGVSLTDVWEMLNRIEGKLSSVDTRLQRLEQITDFTQHETQNAGMELAIIRERCQQRGKRLSEISKKLQIAEDTGVHVLGEINQVKTSWRTVAKIASSIVAGIVAGSGVFAIIKFFTGK